VFAALLVLFRVPLLLMIAVIVFEAQHRDPSCTRWNPNRPMGDCGGEYPPDFLATMLAAPLGVALVVSIAVAPWLLRCNLPRYAVVILAGICGVTAATVLGPLVLPVSMMLGTP
jgi:hypothetical protein